MRAARGASIPFHAHVSSRSRRSSLLSPPPLAAEGRPLKADDLFSLKDVADPRLSPDGR